MIDYIILTLTVLNTVLWILFLRGLVKVIIQFKPAIENLREFPIFGKMEVGPSMGKIKNDG